MACRKQKLWVTIWERQGVAWGNSDLWYVETKAHKYAADHQETHETHIFWNVPLGFPHEFISVLEPVWGPNLYYFATLIS